MQAILSVDLVNCPTGFIAVTTAFYIACHSSSIEHQVKSKRNDLQDGNEMNVIKKWTEVVDCANCSFTWTHDARLTASITGLVCEFTVQDGIVQ